MTMLSPVPRPEITESGRLNSPWRAWFYQLSSVVASNNTSQGKVANLPPAASSKFAKAWVTDSNATLTAGIGAIVAGGGTNVVPVCCDGANWRIG